MANKGKVYGVTVKNAKLEAAIEQWAKEAGISGTAAIPLLLERFFMLPYEQREALESKIQWRAHRNKGFRSLNPFCEKVKA